MHTRAGVIVVVVRVNFGMRSNILATLPFTARCYCRHLSGALNKRSCQNTSNACKCLGDGEDGTKYALLPLRSFADTVDIESEPHVLINVALCPILFASLCDCHRTLCHREIHSNSASYL